MYHFIDRLHTLYGLLQDELSKEIFQARFALDMEPSALNLKKLVFLGNCKDQPFMGWTQPQKDVLKKLNQADKKIILYGAGQTGQYIGGMLLSEDIDFYGFCGRGSERYPDGLLGRPVLSPEELVHTGEFYVVPSVLGKASHTAISQFLQKHNYPKDHILDWAAPGTFADEKQYFEFPLLYHRGTAFIDAGCYDCESSYRFAEWCGGEYSSILAFEPDPDNYAKCCKKMQDAPLPGFQLINAGLSDQEGTAVFEVRGTGSRVIPGGSDFNQAKAGISSNISIRTVAIDDIVGESTVGFIKMDIEGAELDALHGAKNTILRDKPLLAISVYHLQGDLFAIMDYLHQLLPEYRFLLRHYSVIWTETVLYASVDL